MPGVSESMGYHVNPGATRGLRPAPAAESAGEAQGPDPAAEQPRQIAGARDERQENQGGGGEHLAEFLKGQLDGKAEGGAGEAAGAAEKGAAGRAVGALAEALI